MPVSSSLRIERIAALRAAVRSIELERRQGDHACLPFGTDAIDRRLEGGGLALSALHEASGASPSPGDEAASCLFAAGIAARGIRQARGTVLWALRQRDLFAPALAQAGLAPARLLYAECGCDEDVLAVMEEGLRHGGLAAVVGEVGKAPMAATRRLQLAAEEGGTMALLLKRWRRSQEDPLGLPSAAVTRWRIGCLPSERLQVPGVGRARWQLVLARQRGGEPFEWIVEGTDAEGRLALPAHSPHRPLAADVGERRAA
jgi:protein ImuA